MSLLRLSQTRKVLSLSIPVTLECAPGPQEVEGRRLPVAQSVSGKRQEMEPASKVLGRCWEFRPSQPDGSLWRRKGSWGKVYQRTSLLLGTAIQMHALGQLGEAGWMPSHPAGS